MCCILIIFAVTYVCYFLIHYSNTPLVMINLISHEHMLLSTHKRSHTEGEFSFDLDVALADFIDLTADLQTPPVITLKK